MLKSIEIFLSKKNEDHKDEVKIIQKILDELKFIGQLNLNLTSIMKYFSNLQGT